MTKSLYQDHFGIRENPFSIIPDPHYLFMSQRHQEALAHLLYGIGESGGFVLLTGEVGTGKTTICRALIEQLPDTVDLALILNPRLSEAELMASICDEMRIPYPLGTDSLKNFFDFMNRHLLQAHAKGRNPVLLIDEAQNLSTEVLELIRLLTNLETAQKKLLQIILVGQPELNAILAKPEMRQTAQRITARYHLMPLGLVETRAYVHHRLHVAGLNGRVFSNGAVKAVHKAARGIPRLINSVCDRALLGAYVEGRREVSAAMAKKAAAEVLGTQAMAPSQSVWSSLVLALAILGLIFWVGFDPYRTGIKDTLYRVIEPLLPPPAPKDAPPEPKQEAPQPPPVVEEPVREEPILEEPDAEQPIVEDLVEQEPVVEAPAETAFSALGEDISKPEGSMLDALISSATPDRALANLFTTWGATYSQLAGLTPCDKATSAGLSCLQGQTDVMGLKSMNRPAVVSLVMPDGEHVFGVVRAITTSGASVSSVSVLFEDRQLTMDEAAFTLRWPGDYLVLWRQPKIFERALVFGQQGSDVREVRRLLAKAGFADGENDLAGQGSVFYGPSLREKVRTFQNTFGLRVDGIVGPDTLMRIIGVAGETDVAPLFDQGGVR